MNILITGISGFIGKHLVDHFHANGNQIIGLSRYPQQTKILLNNKVAEILSRVDEMDLEVYKINVIVHLAGLAHDVSNNTYTTEDYFNANYEKTRELYDQFLLSNCECFIFFSSIKAASDYTIEGKIDEDVIPNPGTPYGRSKLKAEQYILSKLPVDDKKVYILRPTMIYGPGNKGNLNLLYQFVKRGIPYPLGAFENKRSFLYIKNLQFAIQSMIERKVKSGIYHLADSQYLSTKELILLIAVSLKKKAQILKLPKGAIRMVSRIGDAFGLFFNSHALKKLTENMEISNQKLLRAIDAQLPYTTEEGLKETLKTFE